MIFLLILILVNVHLSLADFAEDTSLTKFQLDALQQLKERVIPKLKYDYQKEEIFLARFLKAKKYDVNQAEDFLLRQIKWRENTGMETIQNEDWSDIEQDYEIRVDGHDKEGRPILFIDFSNWNLRKASLSGKLERVIRWVWKSIDQAAIQVRDLGHEGKNVSRYTAIMDLNNVSPATNINFASTPFYVRIATEWDIHFPYSLEKIYVVNTPEIFKTMLNAVVFPILPKETKDSIVIFGKNKKEWKPVLRSIVDPQNLYQRYGGLKIDP